MQTDRASAGSVVSSLAFRLTLGFGLVLALLCALAGVCLFGLHELSLGLRAITEINTVRSELTHEMEVAVNQAVIGMRNVAIAEEGEEEQAEYRRVVDGLRQYDVAEAALDASFSAVAVDQRERELLAKAKASGLSARRIVTQAQQEIAAGGGTTQVAFVLRLELRTQLAKWNELQNAWGEDLRALNRATADTSREYAERLHSIYRGLQRFVIVAAVLALVVGSVAAVSITRSVTRPLAVALSVAHRVARGELQQPVDVDRRDEVGQLLRALEEMRTMLHAAAAQLRHATDEIAQASNEIESGNTDLSARTDRTSKSLQLAAAALEQIATTVHQSAKSAAQANDLARSASSIAAQGGDAVNDLVRTMDEIDASSKRIDDIVGVIDSIASQTNILALNAAVEAAQSGEHGRGFAVVAREVRDLSKRSAQAATEIKSLISTSSAQVRQGSEFAKRAGRAMVEVVESVDRVTSSIGVITGAAAEQSESLGKVHRSVTDVERMTQQNAALVEESAAAATRLTSQAATLSRLMGIFKIEAEPLDEARIG